MLIKLQEHGLTVSTQYASFLISLIIIESSMSMLISPSLFKKFLSLDPEGSLVLVNLWKPVVFEGLSIGAPMCRPKAGCPVGSVRARHTSTQSYITKARVSGSLLIKGKWSKRLVRGLSVSNDFRSVSPPVSGSHDYCAFQTNKNTLLGLGMSVPFCYIRQAIWIQIRLFRLTLQC